MAVIQDVRFYKEVCGTDIKIRRSTEECCPKESYAPVDRLLWALHGVKFQLDTNQKFSHIYINFTTRLDEGNYEFIAELPVYQGETDWYRYIDVGLSAHDFELLGQKSGDWYLDITAEALRRYFCRDNNTKSLIDNLVDDIKDKKDSFSVEYKSKQSASLNASICVNITNNLKIRPIITVTDKYGNQVFTKVMSELRKSDFFNQYGSVLLNKRFITIRPRKNMFACRMREIKFELSTKQ